MAETEVDSDNMSPEEAAEMEVYFGQAAEIWGKVTQITDHCCEELKRVMAILEHQ